MPYETPSHSPFIPDISMMTSPDVRIQSLTAAPKSNFFQNQHSAMSPLQHRTLSSPAAVGRTPDREHHAAPTAQSRYSFPPQQSASSVPLTPKPLASSFKSPPPGGRYSSPLSNPYLTGAASSMETLLAAGVGHAARTGKLSK
jgi:hypothetical protein